MAIRAKSKAASLFPAKHMDTPGKRKTIRSDYGKLVLDTVESGLPLDALNRFAESSGLTLTEIYDVVIAARTLKHRRARKESLSRDESDKLARLMRVQDQAMRVFGETERALWWLREPETQFEERTPLQMTQTEFGGRLVEEALVQIDEGMFV